MAVKTDPRWMSYPLREKEPLVQFLSTRLATWIVDSLSEELEMPNPAHSDELRHHAASKITWPRKVVERTSCLNWVLQHVIWQLLGPSNVNQNYTRAPLEFAAEAIIVVAQGR